MATESPETSIYQGPAFPFPPPAPCEGFLCYYEAGNNYFTSSMIWKLLISLSIILMILIIVASVIICTNCGCGKKKKRRNSRSFLLSSQTTSTLPASVPPIKGSSLPPKAAPEDTSV